MVLIEDGAGDDGSFYLVAKLKEEEATGLIYPDFLEEIEDPEGKGTRKKRKVTAADLQELIKEQECQGRAPDATASSEDGPREETS